MLNKGKQYLYTRRRVHEDGATITLKIARVASAATYVEYEEFNICKLFKHMGRLM